jgi:N-hydroxyarylamine O-acetyltransferase
MDTGSYLKRIGVVGPLTPADTVLLSLLQKRHLMTVPFENLDIHWGQPIVLNVERFYEKIVVEGRGGFCYELNGLFNELLRAVGYKTRLISARVFNGKEHGPEYDHAAMLVSIGEREYLADVGFGDFTAVPLKYELDLEQKDPNGEFVIRSFDEGYLEVAKRDGNGWKSQYIFKDIARDLSEFAEMCHFQQTSADSHFTQGKVCSIMTDAGRKTLTDKKFLITEHGHKTELEIASNGEFDNILYNEFGIRKTR